MRKPFKRSFSELVSDNKREILRDKKAMERIEDRLEAKHLEKSN